MSEETERALTEQLVSHEHIMEKLIDHEARILENMGTLGEIQTSVKKIEAEIEPLSHLYQDIAAVGRMGRGARALLTWLAGVTAAVAVIWAAFRDSTGGWFK